MAPKAKGPPPEEEQWQATGGWFSPAAAMADEPAGRSVASRLIMLIAVSICRGFIALSDNRHYEATLRRLSFSPPGDFS
ncbi:hypothetical protein NKK48_00405 [Mesorhizobium sp. C386A]|uniref:hypothetical protein n=1 Tax=unclassified Mesorhizobium TaxID=325217 RepID=UPI0012EBB62A|nr:hypothetical protein [Mesorhizobium sp. LNJC386A00]